MKNIKQKFSWPLTIIQHELYGEHIEAKCPQCGYIEIF